MKPTNYIKRYLIFSFLLLLTGATMSCKKGFDVPSPTSSIRITNALSDVNMLFTSFQGTKPLQYYASAARIMNTAMNSSADYITRQPGEVSLALYRAQDTLAPKNPFMELSFTLLPHSAYSLFLTGTANKPESVLIQERFETIRDSVTGIRFINLSPDSEVLSINLVGQKNNPEVTELPYKSISDFKFYPAHSTVASYTFEIRNKNTGDSLTSYKANSINSYKTSPAVKNAWIFNRSTLVIRGVIGGAGDRALNVQLVNHM